MNRVLTIAAIVLAANLRLAGVLPAADFDFIGRSGDAIEVDLGSIPGIAPGTSFSSQRKQGNYPSLMYGAGH